MTQTDRKLKDFRRDIPHEDPAVARLMKICMSLTAELVVVRERLDTFERLADRANFITASDIEAYQPDPKATIERDVIRKRIIRRIFSALKLDAERGVAALAKKQIDR